MEIVDMSTEMGYDFEGIFSDDPARDLDQMRADAEDCKQRAQEELNQATKEAALAAIETASIIKIPKAIDRMESVRDHIFNAANLNNEAEKLETSADGYQKEMEMRECDPWDREY